MMLTMNIVAAKNDSQNVLLAGLANILARGGKKTWQRTDIIVSVQLRCRRFGATWRVESFGGRDHTPHSRFLGSGERMWEYPVVSPNLTILSARAVSYAHGERLACSSTA